MINAETLVPNIYKQLSKAFVLTLINYTHVQNVQIMQIVIVESSSNLDLSDFIIWYI